MTHCPTCRQHLPLAFAFPHAMTSADREREHQWLEDTYGIEAPHWQFAHLFNPDGSLPDAKPRAAKPVLL